MARKRSEANEAPKDVVRVPIDPINEQVIIAAACCSKEAADALLPAYPPDFFFAKGHARMWEVLRAMHAQKLYYDPATVAQMSGGDVDVKYLEELVRERPAPPPNLRHHVGNLRWDRARVEATRGPLSALHEALKDVTSKPDRVRALSRQLADALDGYGSDGYLRSGAAIAREHAAELERRRAGEACFPYGIPGLDVYTEGVKQGQPRMVPGAAPKKTTLFTGVSGSCKSTMAAFVALAQAGMRRRVLFGSWEEEEAISLELIACIDLGYSRADISAGRFNADDQRQILQRMEELGEFIQFFVLPFGRARGERQYNDKALDLVHQVVADARADIFIADLMRRALKETDPDDEEQALFRLQQMGKELNVHQLWLHQQRLKDVEARTDRRPTREGMKGSSAWVEVPDSIIGFHRPALWKSVPDDRLEMIILKQRRGAWPQAIEFDWDPEYVTVENGRTIDYLRPGEESDVDGFLASPKKGKGGW